LVGWLVGWLVARNLSAAERSGACVHDNSPMRHILVGAVVLRADGSGGDGARYGDVSDGSSGDFSTITTTISRSQSRSR